MKITSKGQVTIPLGIRKRFGLKSGTEVDFVAQGETVVLRKRSEVQDPVSEWLESATGVARGKISTAEVMKLTRGEK
jgi:AbrB family looped-hinge helix DNA binding protein